VPSCSHPDIKSGYQDRETRPSTHTRPPASQDVCRAADGVAMTSSRTGRVEDLIRMPSQRTIVCRRSPRPRRALLSDAERSWCRPAPCIAAAAAGSPRPAPGVRGRPQHRRGGARPRWLAAGAVIDAELLAIQCSTLTPASPPPRGIDPPGRSRERLAGEHVSRRTPRRYQRRSARHQGAARPGTSRVPQRVNNPPTSADQPHRRRVEVGANPRDVKSSAMRSKSVNSPAHAGACAVPAMVDAVTPCRRR